MRTARACTRGGSPSAAAATGAKLSGGMSLAIWISPGAERRTLARGPAAAASGSAAGLSSASASTVAASSTSPSVICSCDGPMPVAYTNSLGTTSRFSS